MCGITGFVSFSGGRVDEGMLKGMRDSIAYRGPDDAGIYISGDRSVGLAHRRLAIIDLSPAGHQPMSNEDGSIWITYNGEVFNYRELMRRLKRSGHTFRSNCDTEVIIHLYEEYGTDCLAYLRGQFAFVIWDSVKRRLFGARDHLGIKPLYYRWDGSTLAFASELKALLPAAGKGEIDYGSVVDYLVLQYIPAPKTVYRDIRKLEAGTYFCVEDGTFKVRRFWRPEPLRGHQLPEEILVERLDELLHQSVKGQLVADVPLGVFLSGGVDSSTITYYMSKINNGRVQAFSVGFEEQEYNEIEYAAGTAGHLQNVDHHKLLLKADRAFEIIQSLIESIDEPFADQAIVPTYMMSRYARESVTVCLSGEGSDEIFGGYDRYRLAIERVKKLGELTRFYPDLSPFLRDSLSVEYLDYLSSLCSFRPDEVSSVFTETKYIYKSFATSAFREGFAALEAMDELERLQRFDLKTYLADNLLFKVDRASMLASLEVRVPFLEPELVNFGLGLPFEMRYRSHLQKYILKKLMVDRVPNKVVYRSKMGFSVPIFVWFRKGFYDYLRETLLSRRARERGCYRIAEIEKLLDPDISMRDRRNSLKLWCLLILEEWFRRYHD